MSHLTESVVRHFRALFNRYATGFHQGEVVLSQLDLENLLPKLGYNASALGDARGVILHHDHSCNGFLAFDDFLEFIASYEKQVADKMRQMEGILRAFHHFEKKAKGRFGRSEFGKVLAAGKRMPEDQIEGTLSMIFAPNGTLLDDKLIRQRFLATMSWIEPIARPSFLAETERTIRITIKEAYRLEAVLRPKVIQNIGIRYASLDGFVTITLGDTTKETPVIVDNITPEWNQTLVFPLRLPTAFSEAEKIVKSLYLTFSLHDHRPRGIVSHSEWLCSVSVPLSMLLADGFNGRPVGYLLSLHSPGAFRPGQEQPLLDVSVQVDQDGITEHIEWEETKWLGADQSQSGVRDKIRTDLIALENASTSTSSSSSRNRNVNVNRKGTEEISSYSYQPPLASERKEDEDGEIGENKDDVKDTSVLSDDTNTNSDAADTSEEGEESLLSLPSPLYEHYMTSYKTLRTRFRRRWFQLVAPDDQGTFRPICCYVQPLSPGASLDHHTDAPIEERLARQVACIPTFGSAIPWSGSQTSQTGGGFGISEAPISSPALMLLRRRGSVLDHSILLCSLFLWAGLDAYICTGHAYNNQMHAWVVVLTKVELECNTNTAAPVPAPSPASLEQPASSESDSPAASASASVSTYDSIKRAQSQQQKQIEMDDKSEFRHSKYLSRVSEKRMKFRAQHYESTTGECFSLGSFVGRRPGASKLGGGFGFPFERVACLVNHKNIWVNLQPSDVTSRTIWDLSDPADWQPFLTPALGKFADLGTRMGLNTSWGMPEFTPPDPIPRTIPYRQEFVSHMARVIQGYRRHYLYIPTTKFHRPLSWAAQDMLQTDAPAYAAPGTNVVRLKELSPQLQNTPSNSSSNTPESRLMNMTARFNALSPLGYIWHARIFRFEIPDAEAIVRQLAWTGILDNTILDVMYILGAEVVPLGWGLRSVWVIIGHLAPMQ